MSEKKETSLNSGKRYSNAELHLSSVESEQNERALHEALTEKDKWERTGFDVPVQLQQKIAELQEINPIYNRPKRTRREVWIKALKEYKEKLEATIVALDDIKPVLRQELQAEILRIEEELLSLEEDLVTSIQERHAKKVAKMTRHMWNAPVLIGYADGLFPEQQEEIMGVLETRFASNEKLHEGVEWEKVKKSLETADPKVLVSVYDMEKFGHEPDVYHFDDEGFYIGTCANPAYCVNDNNVAALKARRMNVEVMDKDNCKILQRKIKINAGGKVEFRVMLKVLWVDTN